MDIIDLTLEEASAVKRPPERPLQVSWKRPRCNSQVESTPPPKKRWSGLDPKAPSTLLSSVRGPNTPPNSEQTVKTIVSPGLCSSVQRGFLKRPLVLVPPAQGSLSFEFKPESDTESKYQPSSSTNESDEEFLIPSPSPPLSSSEFIEPPESSEEESDQHSTPSIGGKASARPLQYHYEAGELPLLGFRGYSAASQGVNSENGFRAGAFTTFNQVPACPDVKDPYYINEATRHVTMDDQRPTPFISLTKNPIRAIARAFGAGRKRFTNPRLAVIDLHVLRDAGILQQAENLYLKPDRKYDSRGEFLIWGAIDKVAIVSVIDVSDLLSRPPSTPEDKDVFEFRLLTNTWVGYFVRRSLYKKRLPLSYSTGFALGQFLKLLKIPSYYHDCAGSVIIKDWAFHVKKNEEWQRDKIFCKGIVDGVKHDIPELREDLSAKPDNITLDPMILDDDGDVIRCEETDLDDIFASLPKAYELELIEWEYSEHSGRNRTHADENLPLTLVTLEVEILKSIHDSM